MLFIVALLLWIGLTGFEPSFNGIIFAVLVPSLTYIFANWLNITPKRSAFNLNAIPYFFWLLKEIIKSSINVIKIIWRKGLKVDPTIEWVHSCQKSDVGAVIYGNSITLTPGTITIDVKGDMLLVHALESSSIKELNNKEGSMAMRVNNILK